MSRDMFACLTWYAQKQVTWSPPAFMAKYKNFHVNLKKGEYFSISIRLHIYGWAKFEVDLQKSTEKELGDHTLKDLLYNQIFYTILREKLKAEIMLTESGSRKYFWILIKQSIQGGILKANFVQSLKE